MAEGLEIEYAQRWENPSGWGANNRLEVERFNNRFSGRSQCTILVDRDYESVDPPPPAPQPVTKRVFLHALADNLPVADGWSSPNGYITFVYLNPDYAYYAFAFGFLRQESGRWNAVIQDDLTLEPMP